MMWQFNMRLVAVLVLGTAGGDGAAAEVPLGGPSGATPTRQTPGRPALPQPAPDTAGMVKPAIITTAALAGFAGLSAPRKKLIETALGLARNWPWLPYVYGGADPALGGLDCSGAMYYVLTQCGLSPPRTSAGQYLWLRDHQQLHLVSDALTTGDDPGLAGLRPGDLLFWASGQLPEDANIPNITHVAMYLGRETRDGLRVMINATAGRSYRGTKANGYGVYDLHIPLEASKSKIVGYGSPPGIVASIIDRKP